MADTTIFYDRQGAATAYTLEDGETIYTYTGRAVGYIHEDGFFDFQGRFLAWYLDGWVVESNGSRIFFTKHSKGGPVTPIKGIPPIRGIRQFCPARDPRCEKGLKPAFTLSWSARSGEAFFGKAPVPKVRIAPQRGKLTPVEELDIMDVLAMVGAGPAQADAAEVDADVADAAQTAQANPAEAEPASPGSADAESTMPATPATPPGEQSAGPAEGDAVARGCD